MGVAWWAGRGHPGNSSLGEGLAVKPQMSQTSQSWVVLSLLCDTSPSSTEVALPLGNPHGIHLSPGIKGRQGLKLAQSNILEQREHGVCLSGEKHMRSGTNLIPGTHSSFLEEKNRLYKVVLGH